MPATDLPATATANTLTTETTPMPNTSLRSTPATPANDVTTENTMQAARAKETVNRIQPLAFVRGVPVNSNAGAPERAAHSFTQPDEAPPLRASQVAAEHQHNARGPMPKEHDQTNDTNHLTGALMAATATPTAHHPHLHGDRMSAAPPDDFDEPIPDTLRMITPEDHMHAAQRHRVIRGRLKSISDADAGVLQCAYARRPWPIGLVEPLGRLTGIVVRLACDRETWPEGRGEQLALDAQNAERLEERIRAGGDEERRVLRELRRDARLRFGRAIGAYTVARLGSALSGAR